MHLFVVTVPSIHLIKRMKIKFNRKKKVKKVETVKKKRIILNKINSNGKNKNQI
jgi:hypothetical protein